MQKRPRRENHIGILVDLKAFLDLDIGLMNYLYSREGIEGFEVVDFKFCSQDIKDLFHCKLTDPNFRTKAILQSIGLTPQQANGVLNDVLNENFTDILECCPPVPAIQRLIETLNSMRELSIAKCEVLVRDHEIFDLLRKKFPGVTFLDGSRIEKINFRKYARIIFEDIDDVAQYDGYIQFCHITILSYAKNMIKHNNEFILKPDPVLQYGLTNEFNIMDPLPNDY